MKKKIIIAIAIVIAAILLIPIPLRLKDGGTVRYQAVLYSISDVHRLAPTENDVCYEDGIIIKILGIEVFNNVAKVTEKIPSGDESASDGYALIPMVKIDGVLYLDTGFRKSGVMDNYDGYITSQVANSQKPTENEQSNFGTDYAYRFGETEGTVEIYVDKQWLVFATEEVRQELQFGVKPSVQVYDVELSFANWTDEDKIRQEALNAEKIMQGNAYCLPIYKFETVEELEQFKTDFAEVLTMDSGWDEIPSFNEVSAKYDKEFFEETTVFLVYIGATNSTYRFGLNSIGWDDKSLYIQVEETTGAEFVDCAMAGWFLTVAVSKESVADCTVFDAVMGGIDLTLPTVSVLREAPKLFVSTSEVEIEALKGSIAWMYIDDNGDAMAISGDGNHPLMKEKTTPLLSLVPTYSSSIYPLGARLQFGVAPNEIVPDKVTVRCWSEECWGNTKAESEELPVTIENGNVFVQLKDGNYIYEVIAEWENGKRSYSGNVCYSFYTLKPSLDAMVIIPQEDNN